MHDYVQCHVIVMSSSAGDNNKITVTIGFSASGKHSSCDTCPMTVQIDDVSTADNNYNSLLVHDFTWHCYISSIHRKNNKDYALT